ncbi:PTS system mannose/fructose/sorbose family transporter subunit IID [Coprothermobacter platensis]|uniref:PTS system mannose/fructose/sorbose family transporter subunit IID n=1 Tax=Coprothermobacter platensis TaxID=108819 RepID=UPI00036CF3EF|nr:PTS system mannose/fructose/sorbose family transporter subunit IID [Coprothermobacter platensis]
MSFWQALAIGLIGYMSSIYSPWLYGGLAGWYTTGRPFIAGMLIGLILGDIRTGILMGAAVQALYIGLVTPGGAMPADVNFAAYIGIPLAMAAGLPSSEAVALSVPLSFFGVAMVYLVVTVNSLFVHWQDRLIEQGRLKTAINVPVYGQITNFIVRFFPIFLIDYFGAPYISQISGLVPDMVRTMLVTFGSILPAVGFGLLLSFIIKEDFELLYFLIGFLLVAVLKISIVPVLLVGVFLAYLDVKYRRAEVSATMVSGQEEAEQIEKKKPLLTSRDVRKAYFSWMFWNLSVQNMERMQAPAIVRMLGTVMDKLYDSVEEKKALLARHTPFFNTEPNIGAIVPGVVLGMEEERAKGADVSDELIINTRTALMGPLAGIGDSLLPGTYIPILLSIGLGLSKDGSIAGPLFYIVVFLGTMIPLTMWLFNMGYKFGIGAVETILSSGLKDLISSAAAIVGGTVIGGISATYVAANLGWQFKSGDMTISLQNILDGIFPSLVPLLLTLLAYYLIGKKHASIGRAFFIFFVIAVVGVLIRFFV